MKHYVFCTGDGNFVTDLRIYYVRLFCVEDIFIFTIENPNQ